MTRLSLLSSERRRRRGTHAARLRSDLTRADCETVRQASCINRSHARIARLPAKDHAGQFASRLIESMCVELLLRAGFNSYFGWIECDARDGRVCVEGRAVGVCAG